MRHSLKFIFIMPLLVLLVACQTKNQEVEALAFKKLPAVEIKDSFKNEFTKNILGNYLTVGDEKEFSIDAHGSFKIGETKYNLFNTISSYQAVYYAETPTQNSQKKLYTYHGLIISEDSIKIAPYKIPNFEKTRKIGDKESKYAWELNVLRIENIDWKSGFVTVFATKQ